MTRDECIEEARRVLPDIILIASKQGSINAEKFAVGLRDAPGLSEIPIVVYSDIGKKSDKSQSSGKKMDFEWNTEGNQLLKKVLKLLGTG